MSATCAQALTLSRWRSQQCPHNMPLAHLCGAMPLAAPFPAYFPELLISTLLTNLCSFRTCWSALPQVLDVCLRAPPDLQSGCRHAVP